MSASITIARARTSPTMRGRNQVLPQSGTRPMRVKACRKQADSPASTMSQASAMLMPAPAAEPLTAPTIGFGNCRIARMIGW